MLNEIFFFKRFKLNLVLILKLLELIDSNEIKILNKTPDSTKKPRAVKTMCFCKFLL